MLQQHFKKNHSLFYFHLFLFLSSPFFVSPFSLLSSLSYSIIITTHRISTITLFLFLNLGVFNFIGCLFLYFHVFLFFCPFVQIYLNTCSRLRPLTQYGRSLAIYFCVLFVFFVSISLILCLYPKLICHFFLFKFSKLRH